MENKLSKEVTDWADKCILHPDGGYAVNSLMNALWNVPDHLVELMAKPDNQDLFAEYWLEKKKGVDKEETLYLVQVVVDGDVKVSKKVKGLEQAKEEKERLVKYNARNVATHSADYTEHQTVFYGKQNGVPTTISVSYQKLPRSVEGNEPNTIIFDLGNYEVEVVHHLKIRSTFFYAVKEGKKTFEIRKNDRDYKVGDFLELNEYICGTFTGESVKAQVTYITDYAQKDDYVVLGIKLCEE